MRQLTSREHVCEEPCYLPVPSGRLPPSSSSGTGHPSGRPQLPLVLGRLLLRTRSVLPGLTRPLLLHGQVGLSLDGPVKDVVVLEPFSDEEVPEEFSEVRVVGLVVESERSAVVEVDGELVGESSTEDLGRRGHLYKTSVTKGLVSVMLMIACKTTATHSSP